MDKNIFSSKLNNKNIIDNTIEEVTNQRTYKVLGHVIFGSILYSIAVVWIFSLGNFFAGGATGTSQLISKFIYELGGPKISVGLLTFLVNVPLFLVGFRGVSKKFAILTMVSILVQSLTIFILEQIEFNPFNTPELANERLVLAICGGSLAGLGAAICLKSGGSSGGIDIISNYLVMKKNVSFTKYVFIIDFIIIILGGINLKNGFNYEFATAIYTIIRLAIYLFVIEFIYTSYRPVSVQIITTKENEMRELLLAKIPHGITIFKAVGAYTLATKSVLMIYASSYELNDYVALAKYIDPNAFITINPVKSIYGNYKKRTIV